LADCSFFVYDPSPSSERTLEQKERVKDMTQRFVFLFKYLWNQRCSATPAKTAVVSFLPARDPFNEHNWIFLTASESKDHPMRHMGFMKKRGNGDACVFVLLLIRAFLRFRHELKYRFDWTQDLIPDFRTLVAADFIQTYTSRFTFTVLTQDEMRERDRAL
jgi:hypothetical protein